MAERNDEMKVVGGKFKMNAGPLFARDLLLGLSIESHISHLPSSNRSQDFFAFCADSQSDPFLVLVEWR